MYMFFLLPDVVWVNFDYPKYVETILVCSEGHSIQQLKLSYPLLCSNVMIQSKIPLTLEHCGRIGSTLWAVNGSTTKTFEGQRESCEGHRVNGSVQPQ